MLQQIALEHPGERQNIAYSREAAVVHRQAVILSASYSSTQVFSIQV